MVRRYEEGATPGAEKVEALATAIGVAPADVIRALGGDVSTDTPPAGGPAAPAGRGIPRAAVELRDDGPRPDPNKVPIARIYNSFGDFVGFRYAVTDIQTIPYEVVLHADGTETVRRPASATAPTSTGGEPVSPEDA